MQSTVLKKSKKVPKKWNLKWLTVGAQLECMGKAAGCTKRSELHWMRWHHKTWRHSGWWSPQKSRTWAWHKTHVKDAKKCPMRKRCRCSSLFLKAGKAEMEDKITWKFIPNIWPSRWEWFGLCSCSLLLLLLLLLLLHFLGKYCFFVYPNYSLSQHLKYYHLCWCFLWLVPVTYSFMLPAACLPAVCWPTTCLPANCCPTTCYLFAYYLLDYSLPWAYCLITCCLFTFSCLLLLLLILKLAF